MKVSNITKPSVFISESDIQNRIHQLTLEVKNTYLSYADFNQESLVIVGVLKGAAVFTADLIRALDLPIQLEFVRLTSYGDGTQSGVLSTPDLSLPNIANRHILIVEDIVDTGKTATFLKQYLQDQFQPKSLKLASLLNKPSRRLVQIQPDFIGFEIEDKFVIGYGLDWAEKYRELKYLGIIHES
jgi:hypoxanthine phosphoribosyltransferase